ncbi:hypothetical protein CSC94_19350 [Zhengella mangrovi]|uniref:Uncharacterized protein n=2 Tax=Zhengella mangrovi TaxID=1982044 RepID=A0A2G1QIN8_9HYPH|nr:hypothetical protein CSC94_19350 [Zhengella mangrovi]
MLIRSALRTFVTAVALATLAVAARAETFVGSNIDSRVLVGVKANAQGVQAMMPEGWTSVPFPSGPMKGSNLLLALIDGVLEMDAEGKPLDPPSRRAAVLVGLGKKDDAVRMYVFRMITTVPDRDPYSVATAAEIERTTSLAGPANGGRESTDEWRIKPAGGGELVFSLAYKTGKRSWAPGQLFPHSAAKPDFSRIYRYEQLVDLVASTAVGKPSSGKFSMTSTVTDLGAVLDGSEEIIAVMDVPVYVRKVFLP